MERKERGGSDFTRCVSCWWAPLAWKNHPSGRSVPKVVVLPPWESIHLVAGELEREWEKGERDRGGQRERERQTAFRDLDSASGDSKAWKKAQGDRWCGEISPSFLEYFFFRGGTGEGKWAEKRRQMGERGWPTLCVWLQLDSATPNDPMNKYWFVSREVAHRDNASEGKSSQNAPIRLCVSVYYFPLRQHKSSPLLWPRAQQLFFLQRSVYLHAAGEEMLISASSQREGIKKEGVKRRDMAISKLLSWTKKKAEKHREKQERQVRTAETGA